MEIPSDTAQRPDIRVPAASASLPDTGKLEQARQEMQFVEAVQAQTTEKIAEVKKEQTKVWTEDEFEKAWEELSSWEPSRRLSSSQNLELLLELYEDLKIQILLTSSGKEQALLLYELQELLLHALSRLLDMNCDELLSFLEQYGAEGLLAAIKASLYQQITHEKITSKNYDRFTNENRSRQNTSASGQQTPREAAAFSKEVRDSSRQSYIYNRLGADTGRLSQAGGDTPLSDRAITFEGQSMQFRTRESRIQFINKGGITSRDLDLASQFIRHLKGVYQSSDYQKLPRNEEFLGVFSAVQTLKAETFARSSGLSSGMASILKAAAENYISHALVQANSQQQLNRSLSQTDLDSRTILKTYHYTLKAYHGSKGTGQPAQAIFAGIRYAMELLLEKEGLAGKMAGPAALSALPDYLLKLEASFLGLQWSWNQFLKEMGLRQPGDLAFQNMQSRSLWGAVLEPKMVKGAHMSRNIYPGRLALIGAVLLALLALLFASGIF